MRKLASILSLTAILGTACTWEPWHDVPPEQAELGIKSVSTLQAEYESARSWSEVRGRMDGLTNALQRDLGNVFTTIDRHVFNYSPSDPSVNFPTTENFLSVTLFEVGTGFGGWVLPWIPAR
jgi:hypothetical protein